MSDQTQFQTIGPADPNAGMRAKLYTGLALVTPLLSFLATFGIFTGDQVNAISGFLTATLGLLGTFGFGLAATKTNKQVHDGTFQQAPPDPVGNVFEQLDILKGQVDRTVADATSQVANAAAMIQSAVSNIPGGNTVMSGPVGDLVQSMLDNDRR